MNSLFFLQRYRRSTIGLPMCWARRGSTVVVLTVLTIVGVTSSRRAHAGTTDFTRDIAHWVLGIPLSCVKSRPRVGRVYRGQATYYSDRLAGRSTASGEPYRPEKLTAAHRSWPFGTVVRVTNRRNQKSVEVRINDRGPFGRRKRIIDLSRRAAEQLKMIKAGVVPVTVRILTVPSAD